MAQVISFVNRLLESTFAVLLMPFRGMGPLVPLLVVSLLAGLLMLWAFARWSDQEKLREAKNRIRGHLLGVRLYQHDVRVVLRLQASILRQVAVYFRLSLAPVAVLLLPLLLILIQLNLFFSHRPLEVGRSTVLKVRTAGPLSAGVEPRLQVPEGVTVEAGPVRSVPRGEVSWRIRPDTPGAFELQIESRGETVTKSMVAGGSWEAVSPIRTGTWKDLLLYSDELPLPESAGLASVELAYPPLEIEFLGWRTDWLILFLAASIAAALLTKRFFGVEI